MQYRRFGKTGIEISAVAYGGIVSMDDGQAASDRYVAWAIDQGVNYFDVAPTYGDAEEKLGNSLKLYRNQVHLACKTAERMRAQAEFAQAQQAKALEEEQRAAAAAASAPQPGKITVRSADEFEF